MRPMALVPLILLAACSEAPEPAKETQAPAATELQPGQWEITTEVTQFTKNDEGAPKIDTPVGTRATASHCVTEAEAKKPAPALFAGPDDSCTYRDFYMSGGRINAGLDCRREGLNGQVMFNVNATHTGTSLEGTRGTQTYLSTDGDVQISAKLTGRHVGQCTSSAASQ